MERLIALDRMQMPWPRWAGRLPVALMALALATGAQAQLWPTQDPAPPAPPAPRAPASLDTLVRLLSIEDPLTRWDLAGITLNALVDTYQESLDSAAGEHPDQAAVRRKLWRWRRATGDLVQRLTTMRDALESGAPFELMADAQGQILVVVDQQIIIVSGYDRDSDRRLQRRILDRFCQYNDCWWLGMQTPGNQR